MIRIPPEGLSDENIECYVEIPSAAQLREEIPLHDGENVWRSRNAVKDILTGKSEQRLVIAGPCSIHDIGEARHILDEMKSIADEVADVFFVLTRMCYEKPRTGPSWPGYVWDPDMNGTGGLEKGLRDTRQLLVYAAQHDIGVSAEFVDTDVIPHYTSDTLSHAWIGARTSESQGHHQHASRSSVPIGIKNGLSGNLDYTISAIQKARSPAVSAGRTRDDCVAEIRSRGNPYAHLILRGTDSGPNYNKESVAAATRLLKIKSLPAVMLIDCSHGNSRKDDAQQPAVFYNVVEQMRDNPAIRGAKLEVYIKRGSQAKNIPEDRAGFDRRTLSPGISATDSCMGIAEFRDLIKSAAYELRK